MTSELDLEFALKTARQAVEVASTTLMRHFQKGVAVERKADRSPVTVADRESEAAIIAVIREAFNVTIC
jgi:histidinol-phosphatase